MSRATTSGYPKAEAKSKKKTPAPASERFDYSRTQPMNAQDPRAEGAPCWGHRVVAAPGPGSVTGSNKHATWEGCEVCHLRLSYTPAYGAHGLTRAAGPLAKDVERQLEKVPPNEQKNSVHLKDKKIALDGAEESLLQKLDEVQQKKKQWQETQDRKAPSPVKANPATPKKASTSTLSSTTRKTRKPEESAEQHETSALQEEDAQSWAEVESPDRP